MYLNISGEQQKLEAVRRRRITGSCQTINLDTTGPAKGKRKSLEDELLTSPAVQNSTFLDGGGDLDSDFDADMRWFNFSGRGSECGPGRGQRSSRTVERRSEELETREQEGYPKRNPFINK